MHSGSVMPASGHLRATAVAVPGSALLRRALPRVDWSDAYAVSFPDTPPGRPQEWADAVFRSPPLWIRVLFAAREVLVRLAGIEPGGGHVFDTVARTPGEVLLGIDQQHLSFRASLLLEPTPGGPEHRRPGSQPPWRRLLDPRSRPPSPGRTHDAGTRGPADGGRFMTAIRSTLVSLAEDPEFFIEPPEGSQRFADDRFCVIIGPHRRWAGVCRLRLPPEADELSRTVAEIRRLVAGVELVVWNVGSSATPEALSDRLREHGLREPDPPMDAVCAAMALAEEPPAVRGVDVRRIETLAEHRAGLEVMLAATSWTPRAAADELSESRGDVRETHASRRPQWLAWTDGRPVAYGLADPSPHGLFLAGGSTLPEARGRGCYRALVRARWDEAVRLGTPGLAVQAQYGSSAPILRRLGFTEVASIHTLQF